MGSYYAFTNETLLAVVSGPVKKCDLDGDVVRLRSVVALVRLRLCYH